jgi:hypothetical protein
MPPTNRPQRVTLPTLQILTAFMSDISRDDRYGRALAVHACLGSDTVLQCSAGLERWTWLESWWEDRGRGDARRPAAAALLSAGRGRAAGRERAALGAVQGQLPFAPSGSAVG